MPTFAELQERLESLQEARATGARRVRYSDGRETEFRSDAELVNAIGDLERQISTFGGRAPLKTVLFSTSKGI